jgi:anhydro-N-acetylmuramic acid kinase
VTINNQPTISNEPKYYIGLMSGTSADGIDLALVSFDHKNKLKHHASYYQAYSTETAVKIQALYTPANNEIDRAFSLDVELATLFAKAINAFLEQEQLTYNDIIAIGNHGQTIRHRPLEANPFTLQIGCNQTLATLTNIRVIGQFRRKDMALGGQGAPLVPAFHQTIFSEANQEASGDGADVFVVNIGGISNLTFLPASNTQNVVGYDTGPGNALMDDWFALHNPDSKTKYDENGNWAKKGQINNELLTQFLADNYFQLPAPKSTGREYFHSLWLENQLANFPSVSSEDVQATLTALTAITIVNHIIGHKSDSQIMTKVYICGGGIHNEMLKEQINQQLKLHYKNYELLLTSQKDIDGDQLEAIAFAWLAFAYDKKLLSSMSTVTGASKCCTLGNEYFP